MNDFFILTILNQDGEHCKIKWNEPEEELRDSASLSVSAIKQQCISESLLPTMREIWNNYPYFYLVELYNEDQIK